jgi:hypothetical protein
MNFKIKRFNGYNFAGVDISRGLHDFTKSVKLSIGFWYSELIITLWLSDERMR